MKFEKSIVVLSLSESIVNRYSGNICATFADGPAEAYEDLATAIDSLQQEYNSAASEGLVYGDLISAKIMRDRDGEYCYMVKRRYDDEHHRVFEGNLVVIDLVS